MTPPLSGVKHLELYLILEYIYLGETSVYNSKISRFVKVAKDLQIKILEDTSVKENHNEITGDLENNDDISNTDNNDVMLNEMFYNDNTKEENNEDISDDFNFIDISNQSRDVTFSKEVTRQTSEDQAEYEIKTEFEGSITSGRHRMSSKRVHQCEECEAIYQSKSALHKHISSKHEGILYSCQYCGYAATQKSALKRHEESIHNGVKHSCNQCDYQATQFYHLKKHQKSVHEGMKYSCNQCNFLTGWKNNLRVHNDKKHPLQK